MTITRTGREQCENSSIGAVGLAALALAPIGLNPAVAEDTVKIALIMCYSGQFADTATQMDNAIKLYREAERRHRGGKKIELIRKDTGGIAPDVAKRLAQEADRARSRRYSRPA